MSSVRALQGRSVCRHQGPGEKQGGHRERQLLQELVSGKDREKGARSTGERKASDPARGKGSELSSKNHRVQRKKKRHIRPEKRKEERSRGEVECF